MVQQDDTLSTTPYMTVWQENLEAIKESPSPHADPEILDRVINELSNLEDKTRTFFISFQQTLRPKEMEQLLTVEINLRNIQDIIGFFRTAEYFKQPMELGIRSALTQYKISQSIKELKMVVEANFSHLLEMYIAFGGNDNESVFSKILNYDTHP